MKEIRFLIDIPPIEMSQLSSGSDFRIIFQVRERDFSGSLAFDIDPESIEWDSPDDATEVPKSFNKLIVSLTTQQEISYADFLEDAYLITAKYLDTFFRFVQIELGQYWVNIGPIRQWSLSTFLRRTNANWIINGTKKEIGISRGKHSKQKKILISPKRRIIHDWYDTIGKKEISAIKTWVEKYKDVDLENSISLEKILLSDAKRLLLNGDYKSSAILAVAALENPLESFVKNRCKNKGVKKDGSTVSKNLQLFPQILETEEFTNWIAFWIEEVKQWHMGKIVKGDLVINWATKLNQARNKAVHKGKTPEFETLDKGIFAVEAIYSFTSAESKQDSF